jgi:DNA-directed RNA polymerase specialized sigma24 family protein
MEQTNTPIQASQEHQVEGVQRALRDRAYSVLDDEALVRRARARDYPAFDALVARYRNRLYTVALGSLRSEVRAGDALCEIAVSAFRDIGSSLAVSTAGVWLYLHTVRTVFRHMNLRPGAYRLESRLPVRPVARRSEGFGFDSP